MAANAKVFSNDFYQSVEDELFKNILPYWEKYSRDNVNKGFYGRIDNDNNLNTACERSIVMTSRFLWTYSCVALFKKDKKYLEMVSNVKYKSSKTNHQSAKAINISIDPDKYYVEMMCAWYFATALAKQYESTILYIQDHRLDVWTHNKTIQKAIESYRITDEAKEYLRGLKIKT